MLRKVILLDRVYICQYTHMYVKCPKNSRGWSGRRRLEQNRSALSSQNGKPIFEDEHSPRFDNFIGENARI